MVAVHLTCQSCGARFSIADDRIRGKLVHLRCRSCGTVFEAHLPRHGGQRQRAQIQVQVQAERHEPPPLPRLEWFAAVGDKQVGPLDIDEMALRIRRGELGAEDLVWRRGLGYWQPIVAVEDLRGALNEPAVPAETQPPPLPPHHIDRGRGQLLQLVPRRQVALTEQQAAAALALAETYPAPQEMSRPTPLAVIEPQPLPPARWPLWVALLGGLMMLGSSGMLLVRRRGSDMPVAAPSVSRRVEVPSPVAGLRSEPEAPVPSQQARELPPLELRRSRNEHAAPAPRELPSDQQAEASDPTSPDDAMAGQLGTTAKDVKTALALRIYRQNRSTLSACDALAERRGETIVPGSRAVFQVRVNAEGGIQVEVRARGLSPALLSCYRIVARRWEVPITGSDYATSFDHVH